MKHRPLLPLLVTLVLCTSSCLDTRVYVDPTLPKIALADLAREHPHDPITVDVQWLTNGVPKDSPSARTRETYLDILEQTGLFESVLRGDVGASYHLSIVIDNAGGESGSGVMTGLSLGAIGTATIDRYQVVATLEQDGHDDRVVELQHALHGTVGFKDGPEGLEPLPVVLGAYLLKKEILLFVLFELERGGAFERASR